MDSSELYITSIYFTTTTITTVGYGDMSGSTVPEKIFLTILMIISFGTFTLAIGNVTSLLQTYDN